MPASLDGPRRAPVRLAELPDEELVALSKQGDEAAFGEFVRRHTGAVHRWMARSVGEQEAEDMTQEVFLKAYRGLARFRGEAPPRAWLASIADNAVKNRYRARGRFRRIFSDSADSARHSEPPAIGADPEERATAGQSRHFIAEALRRLPVAFRMPVVLRDLEEWSYEDISVSLRLPVGTVKSRIARGRAQLRTLLLPLLNSGKAL